ncbi:helix-turn-helix domain-containing protein [Ruminiclostridium cellulolyticum]|uniref:Plasmid maintenance system antidote protein, XRE family n=1 Tax=Ruminiclostridium cellulolyticum (strain ATCC 35319 / DSM 5812 / JCM 6584 / H10) TaxID=394503 RepID=B8I007_RUMCH|nr:helix-turn-helix transcriptional regulator [Ruminiclostridium cellulolyticum]ACL75507.1 plasmid maintenance system antidote protein, XRE family [Ruminiclostridium cellulolyticum H10]
MSRIGQEINKLRLKKGMTPKQLARALGVSEKFVLDIESGKKIVSDDMIGRVSKALDFELGPIGLFASDDKLTPGNGNDANVRSVKKVAPIVSNEPVQQVWDDAFGNILKTVPVYDYKMDRIIDKKLLPIEKNRVEGYAKEKVFYLDIEDTDMSGFRIFKGDRAFGILENQIDKDGIYLIEYNGERAVRQVKKLHGNKLLLVYNRGTLITETVGTKEIKVIARLIKLEITL